MMHRKPPLSTSINFGHPMAQGLICCLLVNEEGGPLIDALTGQHIPLTGLGTRDQFRFGEGLSCNASDAGARATIWDRLNRPSSQCTVLFRGLVATGGDSFATLFGVAYTLPAASPFTCFLLDRAAGGTGVRMTWNSAGVQATLSGTPTTYDGTERQYVGIVRGNSGLCELYETTNVGMMTQLASATGSFGPSFTASSHIDVGGGAGGTAVIANTTLRHAYIWERALTATEIRQIWQEPYAFVGKPTRRIAIPVTPPPSVFRRSRSELGTRVGSRQMVN